jgi:hypothetical protein
LAYFLEETLIIQQMRSVVIIGKKLMEDRNAPATKGDLTDLESRLDERLEIRLNESIARLNESIEILRSEMNHQYRELVERISDTQTEVLRAFYSFAQTNNKRVLEVEGK